MSATPTSGPMNPFRTAVKHITPLRLGVVGPSGSGKTWTSLALARLLVGAEGTIAALDTERGTMRRYAHIFDFDHAAMKPPYAPRRIVPLLEAAALHGYDLVLLDSISHFWEGSGGVQEIVDQNKKGGNEFSGWAVGSPEHRKLIDAMLGFPGHTIATMRAKTVWADVGSKPKKVGLGAVQRSGMEYEFDIIVMLDMEHVLTVDKTRCPDLDGMVFGPSELPAFVDIVKAWLALGVPRAEQEEDVPVQVPEAAAAQQAEAEQTAAVLAGDDGATDDATLTAAQAAAAVGSDQASLEGVPL